MLQCWNLRQISSQPKGISFDCCEKDQYVSGTVDYGIWYSFDTKSTLVRFSDVDQAVNADDRKSTSGGCFYLRNNVVSWFSKKQNSVALSTAEAEYISAGSCCAQILWIKQQLKDFGSEQNQIPILCDNTSAINISKNPIQHSRTKHIEIRHHFIRDHVQKGDIVLEFVDTKHQLADIFTKPLSEDQFSYIRRELGMIDVNEV